MQPFRPCPVLGAFAALMTRQIEPQKGLPTKAALFIWLSPILIAGRSQAPQAPLLPHALGTRVRIPAPLHLAQVRS